MLCLTLLKVFLAGWLPPHWRRAASLRSISAVLVHQQKALCFLYDSKPSPASLQRFAEAASLMHCVNTGGSWAGARAGGSLAEKDVVGDSSIDPFTTAAACWLWRSRRSESCSPCWVPFLSHQSQLWSGHFCLLATIFAIGQTFKAIFCLTLLSWQQSCIIGPGYHIRAAWWLYWSCCKKLCACDSPLCCPHLSCRSDEWRQLKYSGKCKPRQSTAGRPKRPAEPALWDNKTQQSKQHKTKGKHQTRTAFDQAARPRVSVSAACYLDHNCHGSDSGSAWLGSF